MIGPPPSSPLFPYTTLFRSPFGAPRSPPKKPGPPASSGASKPSELPSPTRFPTIRSFDCTVLAAGQFAVNDYITVQSNDRSEEHTSELQSHLNLVCRLLLEK